MCELCENIENDCKSEEGKTYICECYGTYNLVHIDVDDCSPACIEIKYCPMCGRKLATDNLYEGNENNESK
jgi:hypothetical protein